MSTCDEIDLKKYSFNYWPTTAAMILEELSKYAAASSDKEMLSWLTEKGSESHA